MKTIAWAVPMVLALAAAAEAQDGGKLTWRGKGKDEPKFGMAEAQKQGKAMMLFFTSEG
jgi:hypothetical protein